MLLLCLHQEYSSCLQLNGYQTVDDLMSLREHHLLELNVSDPEHRRRLLSAVDSLQQLRREYEGSAQKVTRRQCHHAHCGSIKLETLEFRKDKR